MITKVRSLLDDQDYVSELASPAPVPISYLVKLRRAAHELTCAALAKLCDAGVIMNQTYNRWRVQAADLVSLTPEKARDLITRCLLEAQKETFARNEQVLGHMPGDRELQSIVEGTVRLAFRETKQDYDNPTRQSLMKVVEVLARKLSSWGTPAEIIEHHKEQIARVLRSLG